jgi:GntR family transcriptional regulator/MocR family aminotransferase
MQARGAEGDGVIAMLSVALDRNTTEPLVRQLYMRVRELILTQRLPAGTRLPSTRKLSRDLEVSRTVSLDAFGQLAAEGFIHSQQGSGHFVAALPLAPVEAESSRQTPTTDAAGTSIYSASGAPFDPAWQAADIFPSQVWARMLGRGWRRHQEAALERHWAGLPVLRQEIARHLHALRGLALTPDQIMVTAGNSDILRLIARTVAHGGSGEVAAWVEDPGLGTARQILSAEGLRLVPIPVDGQGLMVAEGERRAAEAGMALITPTRQFPLGMPLSLSRRLSLLAWSRRSGALLVDDDYDGEVRFSGRPLQSLASLDGSARVLTLGSFSKLTFSGLRLGYAAGPADLISELAARRCESYALLPTPIQAGLAEFIATGSFARHLRQLRTRLTRRRRVLHDLLRRDASDLVEILPQEAGMHLTVSLADGLARKYGDVAISKLAGERGLVLLPLSPQYSSGRGEPGFLLGYAGWDEQQLVAAVTAFVELLRNLSSSREVVTSNLR